MLSSEHGGAAFTAGAETGRPRPGFDVFDDVVLLRETRGVIGARVTRLEDGAALAAHIVRRADAVDRVVVKGTFGAIDSAWRDVAVRLGVETVPTDPLDAARAIVARATARRAVVVVPLFASSSWEEAVSESICETTSDALFVLVTSRDGSLALSRIGWFDIDSSLDGAGLARWWDGFAAVERREHETDLLSLEAWRVAARKSKLDKPNLNGLPAPAQRLFARLSLVERAWPLSELGRLHDELGVTALIQAGLVESRDGLVATAAACETGKLSADELRHVAQALQATFGADAWALARAAELVALSHDLTAAERTMRTALELATDGSSRAELWRRWRRVVEGLDSGERPPALIRGAELALDLGDVDSALEWAESAAAAEAGPPAAHVLGRAALARGDLVMADAALRRAYELASNELLRTRALVDRAEVRYASGDFVEAEALVREPSARCTDAKVRLAARNLLGKLLLARAEWDAAEQHFATDACDAAFAGEFMCELRARVNRAIALLSRGSPDEARPILLDVLHRAEEHGEQRAIGFALSNLAVLAIDRHEYGQALELSERAIVVRRRLGDRLGFARDVTNLVELRLRLGLVDQAEQALRFGRQALGPGAPASRLAELALTAARVHLAKNRPLDAERELRTALRTAAHASDGDKLAECHRLAARIALEDGVVTRAEAELERACELSSSPFARGEVALLRAMVARAAGRPSTELANLAVTLARESGDEELAREAHVLAAEIAVSEGRRESAAEHVALAIALRGEVARTVTRDTRDAYLARRDLLRLSRLERLIDEPREEDIEEPPLRTSMPPKPAEPAQPFVGRHPAVRALLESIKRVGRTGATVLVRGESGTGKELVAELLHRASDRSTGPLVKVNCAALVESLLLSELFGHEKGAFTGAMARKRGRFERANGGTLLLDEIGDISPRTQVALLRVLEERTIERVGGTSAIPVDVRIVCATNRDLYAMVERGDFREDLFYRLSGLELEVPPLRDRPSDLPVLCDALLARIARERAASKKGVSPDALELLARHRWPGNVRELENALRTASLFAEGDTIEVGDLIAHVDALRKLSSEPATVSTAALSRVEVTRPPSAPPAPLPFHTAPADAGTDVPVTGAAYREIRDAGVSLSDLKRRIERECIARALSETGGNITRAAAVLGMKRPRLSQLVKQYGLLAGDDLAEDEEAPS